MNAKCIETTRGNSYPTVRIDGRLYLLSRIVMAGVVGRPLTADEQVLHSCDNPKCINPAHLRIGTHADNMEDMKVRRRSGQAKLMPDQVREIRQVPRYKGVLDDLAAKFNVTPSAINAVRSRRNYGWVK